MTRSYQESPLATKQRRAFEPNQTQTNDRLVDTPHAIGPLLKLRAAAAESPAARDLQSLQRKADARAQIQPPPRAAMRGVARDLPLPSLQRKSKRGGMATSPSAMAASLHPANNQGPAIFGIPNANEIALQRIATTAQDTVPGQPMAVDLPLLDALGMTARSMSNEEYAQWSETVQCKMGMHGKQQMGDRTIVTQLKPNADVVQLSRIGRLFRTHKAKFTAGLVMFEAGLTVAAAMVGFTAASSIGAVNLMVSTLAAAIVGVAKFVRGLMMMWQAFQSKEEQDPMISKIIDVIRLAEAVGAAVALGFAAPGVPSIIAGALFAFAKGLRSLIIMYMKRLDAKIEALQGENEQEDAEGVADAIAALNKKKTFYKNMADVCHGAEVLAISIGGVMTGASALTDIADGTADAMTGAKGLGAALSPYVAAGKTARIGIGRMKDAENDNETEQGTIDPEVAPEPLGSPARRQEEGVIPPEPRTVLDDDLLNEGDLALPATTK